MEGEREVDEAGDISLYTNVVGLCVIVGINWCILCYYYSNVLLSEEKRLLPYIQSLAVIIYSA